MAGQEFRPPAPSRAMSARQRVARAAPTALAESVCRPARAVAITSASPMNIVIPDDYPPTYASLDQADLMRLAPHGEVTLYTSRAADRVELFSRIAPAEVLINVRAYTALDDEAFSHAPGLRMVSILGTGTDNVDLLAAKARGITVTNTPGVGAPSVAELTLGVILAVTRAI